MPFSGDEDGAGAVGRQHELPGTGVGAYAYCAHVYGEEGIGPHPTKSRADFLGAVESSHPDTGPRRVNASPCIPRDARV